MDFELSVKKLEYNKPMATILLERPFATGKPSKTGTYKHFFYYACLPVRKNAKKQSAGVRFC